jgi:hypothetical protein
MSYEKQNFVNDQTLTADHLNYIENGIAELDNIIANYHAGQINIKDFGAVGDGVADDTAAFQAAVDEAYLLKRPLIIPQGDYVITDTINCSPMIHIIPVGTVNIIDKGTENEISINMQSKDDEPVSNDEYFTTPNISDAFGHILLMSNTRSSEKTGLYITGLSSEGNAKRNNALIKGLMVKNYHRGVHIDSQNTYMITMERCIFGSCDYGLFFGNDEGYVKNTGESFIFTDCLWGNCRTAVKNLNNINLEAIFIGCRIDMCGCAVIVNTAKKFTFNDCRFEAIGVGSNYVETNEDFEGIIKASDSNYFYDRTLVTLNDCLIVMLGSYRNDSFEAQYRYPSTKLFIGSRMILTLNNLMFDCHELYWYYNTILNNDIEKMFCVDNNIKQLNVNNNYTLYNQNPFLKSNENVLTNPYFENETNDRIFTVVNKKITDTELGDFNIVDSDNIFSAQIMTDTTINKKCLKIQCQYDNTNSYVTLESKQKFPIVGKHFDAVVMMKGYKYYHWSNIGTNILCHVYAQWYDLNDQFISEDRIYNSYRVYRGDDDYEQYNVNNADKWMISHVNENGLKQPPKNASYYKIKVQLHANRGDDIYKAVYFTGIHVFNNR